MKVEQLENIKEQVKYNPLLVKMIDKKIQKLNKTIHKDGN
jgi:hypothetical protein